MRNAGKPITPVEREAWALEALLRAVDRLSEWPDDVSLRLAVFSRRRDHVQMAAEADRWREEQRKKSIAAKAAATREENRQAAKERLAEIRRVA